MPIRITETDRPPPAHSSIVTVLAGCWAFSGACGFFQSALVTHQIAPCVASFVPLVSGWAALERKRWGRLALLGMSWTILGACILGMVTLILIENHYGHHVPRRHAALVALLMRLYSANQPDMFRMPLAALSGLWLWRSRVIAEFNTNKRTSLAVMQHCIALTLVLVWCTPFLGGRAQTPGGERSVRLLSPMKPEPAREARR